MYLFDSPDICTCIRNVVQLRVSLLRTKFIGQWCESCANEPANRRAHMRWLMLQPTMRGATTDARWCWDLNKRRSPALQWQSSDVATIDGCAANSDDGAVIVVSGAVTEDDKAATVDGGAVVVDSRATTVDGKAMTGFLHQRRGGEGLVHTEERNAVMETQLVASPGSTTMATTSERPSCKALW